ncbi:biotin/lipoate--protein ligase family protein [Elioraea tepidiphila]|jgi:biotin-(acetyl-CoA carboxylase) ligase|uniref:biotin/lipoate--protein ligase family protein n=1 Tax=Elioraea tepidiphila TaxID=457934 RepID=UPI002FDA697B
MRAEARGLDLPPLYREVRLREAGDAFVRACAIASEAGAGTLVWSRSPRLFDVAVVLEPAMPLVRARNALYVGMTALADALAVHAPPENPISFVWPDLVEVNGGAVGGVRLAWEEVGALRAPAWMVLHAALRLVLDEGGEPGETPGVTALAEEGYGELDGATLAESYARHLMAGLHDWQDQGFSAVATRYLERLDRPRAAARGLDPSGDLLLRAEDGTETRHALAPALAMPSWLHIAGLDA